MSEPEDYQELADDLTDETDRLQHEADKLGEDIAGARKDWEQKRADGNVPGANAPDPAEAKDETDTHPGEAKDETDTD